MTDAKKSKIELLKEKLDAAQAAYDAAVTAESQSAALAAVKKGDLIEFLFGRGETRAQHTGQVRAVVETDKGKKLSVLFGEGLDEKIVTVDASAVVSIGEFKANHNGGASVAAGAAADPLEGLE